MKKSKVKVLLTRTVAKLGEPGDVVEVAPGYARNYLLPKGLAVEPTPHNVERLQKIREQRLAELRSREEQARALKEKIDGAVLTFYRRAHDDQLYSSVRAEDIVAQLAERFGAEIERSRVQLDRPIEVLGRHPVTISLYKDITAEVEIEVLPEGAEDEPGASSSPEAELQSKSKPESTEEG